MREVTQFEIILWDALHYLGVAMFIIIPALTAFWSFSAFRSSKKKGYAWIAIFALSPYFIFLVNQIGYQLHKESIEELNSHNLQEPIIVQRTVSLPIYNLILAAGVFSLARSERKTEAIQSR